MRILPALLGAVLLLPSLALAEPDSDRIAALEARLAALERTQPPAPSPRVTPRLLSAAQTVAPFASRFPGVAAMGGVPPMLRAVISGGGGFSGGTVASATTFSDDVTFNGGTGAVTVNGQQIIDGTADEIQLRIQGNATQTTKPFVVENSAGTDVFTVSNTGTTVLGVTGDLLTIAPGQIQQTGAGTNLILDAAASTILRTSGVNRVAATQTARIVLTPPSTFGVDIETAGSKVTCDATSAGSLFYENTAADSVVSKLFICSEKADNSFAWGEITVVIP